MDRFAIITNLNVHEIGKRSLRSGLRLVVHINHSATDGPKCPLDRVSGPYKLTYRPTVHLDCRSVKTDASQKNPGRSVFHMMDRSETYSQKCP